MKRVSYIVLLYYFTGCISSSPSRPSEPVHRELIPKSGDISASPVLDISAKDKTESATKEVKTLTATETTSDCQVSSLLPEVPGYVDQLKIVVTRVNPPCQLDSDSTGYLPESSWMAMGFPCTAGKGDYTIRGKSFNPKMVIYRLENDCPMAPSNTNDLRERVKGLGQDFLRPEKLLALTPFSLLYWESVEYPDADVGPTISMFSQAFLKEGWEKFRKGQVLNFRMYGQENAWVTDKHFFAAEVELSADTHKKFKINLKSVKVMDDADLEKIRSRCDSLRPQRSCTALSKG